MVTPTVTIRSLDRAWTAFVNRWNLEGREAFEAMLKKREADHARLSVGELAGQVCRLSWDQDRRCCIAHFEDGCSHCRELGLARPGREEWRRIVEAAPITEVERDVIGRYRRALDEARRAGRARPQRDPSLVRGPPRTPPRSPEHQQGGRHEVPSYPAWGPTSAPSSAVARGSEWRGDERRDSWARRGDQRGPQYGRQYGEHFLPYQQAAPDGGDSTISFTLL
ncbi:hypothetical protein DVH05_026028 [Phytophthora capsici]|nr:hypothetical protein DVH05_026028 [Phytophthora capsici]